MLPRSVGGRDAELEGVAFETLGLHCDPKHLYLSFTLATSTRGLNAIE